MGPTGPLAGQSALITAGGTGIGFGCARHLLRDGASVTIVARREEVLADAAERLREDAPAGATVQYAVCDVADEEQVTAAVTLAAEPNDGLHICVASAGVGSLGPVYRASLEDWRSVLDVNLIGTFLTFKYSAKAIADSGGGSMVAISSSAGSQVHPWLGLYGASKAAIDMMVDHLADELGPFDVRVNTVAPGLIETEMMEIPMQATALVDDYLQNQTLSRVGTPDDVAAAVRYLVGPESSWVTGTHLQLDGGMHLRRAADYQRLAQAMFGEEAAEQMRLL